MPEKSSLHKCIPLRFSEISTSRRNQIAGSKDRCVLNCDRRRLSVLYGDYFKETSRSPCECDTFTRLFKVEFSAEVASETQGSHPPSSALCRDVLTQPGVWRGSERQKEPDGAGQMWDAGSQVLVWSREQMVHCRVPGKDSACHFPVTARNVSLCSLGK